MNMRRHLSKSTKGATLIEALIATSIIMAFLVALVSVHNTYLSSSFSDLFEVKATYLVEEGIEAVKGLRDASWTDNIAFQANDTPYYLNFVNGAWTLTATPLLIDSKFSRTVTFSSVGRSSSSDIVATGGTSDPNTRRVTVVVSWPLGGTTATRSIETYITNIFSN